MINSLRGLFLDAHHGWIGTESGTIFRTTDGENWSAGESYQLGMATGISFSDGLNGWTVVEQRYSWDTTTATLAYKIGQRNGMQEGTKVANWLEAERELTGRGGLVRTSEVGVHWEFFDDPCAGSA